MRITVLRCSYKGWGENVHKLVRIVWCSTRDDGSVLTRLNLQLIDYELECSQVSSHLLLYLTIKTEGPKNRIPASLGGEREKLSEKRPTIAGRFSSMKLLQKYSYDF